MISIGSKPVLDFEVKFALGDEIRQHMFGELIDRPTLVSVFMRANTGSCDRQMTALAAGQERFDSLGVGVIGVSRDTARALSRYAAKQSIAFPLVSDPEFQFAEAVDSLVEKKMYGKTFMGPLRAAYAFDAQGKLVGLIETVDPANHGEEALELMESI